MTTKWRRVEGMVQSFKTHSCRSEAQQKYINTQTKERNTHMHTHTCTPLAGVLWLVKRPKACCAYETRKKLSVLSGFCFLHCRFHYYCHWFYLSFFLMFNVIIIIPSIILPRTEGKYLTMRGKKLPVKRCTFWIIDGYLMRSMMGWRWEVRMFGRWWWGIIRVSDSID